jgi:hypothetical protein
MSAINKVEEVRARETEAARCGYVPLFTTDYNDTVKVGEQFLQQPSIDHGIRVQCWECNFGSLWKLGMRRLDNINEALCSNDECSVYITLKLALDK